MNDDLDPSVNPQNAVRFRLSGVGGFRRLPRRWAGEGGGGGGVEVRAESWASSLVVV